jgi:mannose-6-phosphate isomerase-like protein (cupin superfamily)
MVKQPQRRQRVRSVDRFSDLPYYEQESGPGIVYQFVVKPGALGLLSAGRVRAKGPTTKAADAHPEWDQIYLILRGTGKVLVGSRYYRVAAGSVVRIPRGARHAVRLASGERIEYVYVNAFTDRKALDRCVRAAK